MPSPSSRAVEYVQRVRALGDVIAAEASNAERLGNLPHEVVDALHDRGIYRMMLPARLGGGDLDMPDSLYVFEEAARHDGATGWNVAICGGGPMFGHLLGREAYEAVFAEPRAVIAGSLNPMTTTVTPVDGGYRFSGRSTFVSGSAQASWLVAAGIVLRDGVPRLVDGVPEMRSGLFPMHHCRIQNTWSVSGMRGTGSNDCIYEDVVVPNDFTYSMPAPGSSWKRGAFGSIPLATLLGSGLAAVALGVARHAIEAFEALAGSKVPAATRSSLRERPLAQIQFAQAEGLLRAARSYLFDTAANLWADGEAGLPCDATAQARSRLAAVTAAKLAAEAVDLIYDAAGSSSISTSCAIERCWRDVHAITQHVILSTGRFEVIGRVLLGLDPGTPLI